jgi:hypothetical protein
VAWRDGQLSVEEAAEQIAKRYREWVSIFEEAQGNRTAYRTVA